jgi:hypothetical protein
MKHVCLALMTLWTAGSALAAETAQQRGRRVVDEALAALGGPAFQKMEDRLETGRAYSFYNGELNGLTVARLYTRYLASGLPGKLNQRERESFGKKEETSAVLFTEEGAWEITYRGAKPLEDQRYANYKDSVQRNIFYILRQRMSEPGLTFYSMGSDRYENRPVEIVDITDAEGLTVTVYFDQFSKLPVRQVYKRRNPEFKDFDTEVSLFGKYRDVGGGVKWPFDVRRDRNGDKIFEMYADSVTINKGLTDDLFTLPANLKILPKPK